MKIKLAELRVNDRARENADIFTGSVTLFNKNKVDPVPILDVKCEWRHVGNPEWKPVTEFVVENVLPFTCEPLQPAGCFFTATIESPEKKVRWFNKAWIARRQPIRFRLTFEDAEGAKSSQVFEYCYTPFKVATAGEADVLFVKADKPDTWERESVSVKKNSGSVITIDGNDYSVKQMRALVYQAQKTGETELLLKEGNHWSAWGLVDLNCKRVYAIKVLVWTEVSASVGYAPLELYGHVDEVKTNQPAVEKQTLPEIATDPETEFIQDDDFDDNLIVPQSPVAAGTGAVAGNVLSFDQNSLAALNAMNENLKRMADSMSKLDSMEKSMIRLAEAFEGLAGVLAAKK
eukprot:TRINITY_DN2315_c0_g3_i2.p1 TRINITY_DN2315_c0_g3~~TRINITY_DN2315_c0_g3_i2.p1  ORF type:complete len:347 (+),score=87.69 TRINITY_DN2315_c0_g3_i2:709-1749(+)